MNEQAIYSEVGPHSTKAFLRYAVLHDFHGNQTSACRAWNVNLSQLSHYLHDKLPAIHKAVGRVAAYYKIPVSTITHWTLHEAKEGPNLHGYTARTYPQLAYTPRGSPARHARRVQRLLDSYGVPRRREPEEDSAQSPQVEGEPEATHVEAPMELATYQPLPAPQHVRPSWDEHFMSLAQLTALRATCDRKRVGAVFARDHRVLSTGYNGAPPGLPHCTDAGHLMEGGHCIRTVHAELNGILQAAKAGVSLEGCDVYVNTLPCYACTLALVSVGVRTVFHADHYRSSGLVHALVQSVRERPHSAGSPFKLVYLPGAAP